MIVTARQLITSALGKINVLAAGETPSAEDADEAFNTLNSMVDSWNTDRLLSFTISENTPFTLNPGVNSVTIGPSADINVTERPVELQDKMYFRYNNVDYLAVRVNREQWSSIALKTLAAAWPQYFYYDAAYPVATIRLYPQAAFPVQMYVATRSQITQFADLDTEYELPQGYKRALEFSLAEELYGSYPKPIDPTIVKFAFKARAAIKRLNKPNDVLQVDPRMLNRQGIWNIYSNGS